VAAAAYLAQAVGIIAAASKMRRAAG